MIQLHAIQVNATEFVLRHLQVIVGVGYIPYYLVVTWVAPTGVQVQMEHPTVSRSPCTTAAQQTAN